MELIKTKADIDYLDEVTEFIDGQLEEAGCSMEVILSVELSVEEVFTNVASYAYCDGEGEVEITFEKVSDPDRIRIEISDNGLEFDPLKRPDPDISETMKNDNVGGLGIYVVKNQMDTVTYRYENERNILKMEKAIN